MIKVKDEHVPDLSKIFTLALRKDWNLYFYKILATNILARELRRTEFFDLKK